MNRVHGIRVASFDRPLTLQKNGTRIEIICHPGIGGLDDSCWLSGPFFS